MGSFSYSCHLSGLPITSGSKAGIIILKLRENLYDHSEKNLRKYGKSCFISNEGPCAKFTPIAFPIFGTYDDYGGIENLIEDTNTKVLEEYFGLTIDEIVGVLTCGRKDDGFDGALDVVKDPAASNQDRDEDGRLSPTYQEKFNELLSLSVTWIHGDVYDALLENSQKESDYDKVDIGTPAILEALGFTEIEGKSNDDRYVRQFKNGDVILNSDGTWLGLNHIYTLPALKEYCAEKGLDLDISELNSKTRIEQIYDYLLPPVRQELLLTNEEDGDNSPLTQEESEIMNEVIEGIGKGEEPKEMTEEKQAQLKRIIQKTLRNSRSSSRKNALVNHIFLEGYYHNQNSAITHKLIMASDETNLREHVKGFSMLTGYMYATGRYWDIIGTTYQDGDYRKVLHLLETSANVIKTNFADYLIDEDDDE